MQIHCDVIQVNSEFHYMTTHCYPHKSEKLLLYVTGKVPTQWEALQDLSPLLEQACNETRPSQPSASNSRVGSRQEDKPTKLSPSLARTTVDKPLPPPVLHQRLLSQVLVLLNLPEEIRELPSQPLEWLALLQLHHLEASLEDSNPLWVVCNPRHGEALLLGSKLWLQDWLSLKTQSALHPTLS